MEKLGMVVLAAKTGDKDKIKSVLKTTGVISAKNITDAMIDNALTVTDDFKSAHETFDNVKNDIKKKIDKATTSDEVIAATGSAEEATAELIADDTLRDDVSQTIDDNNSFTSIGWARLAAKTVGYVLNHGKDVIDALGAKKIANDEDKNIIAEIRTQIENDDTADMEYADSEFSVRFTVDDFKWHATCLDNRKMKFPEDILIKKVLDTPTGQKFKKVCLQKWKNICIPDLAKDYKILPFMLSNIDKFGLDDGNTEFFEKVKLVSTNMDKIEQQFK